MYYQREISTHIKTLAKEFSVLVVTGARQVGKTTLLKELFPHHRYVSLDIPSTAELASANPDLFLQKYAPPLIIDEVQYAPQLFRYLKSWVDQNRARKGAIILTGSQKFVLMKELADSLAGRAGFIEMDPLSIFEIRAQVPLTLKDLPKIMGRGFFPELWREPERSARAYYQAYLNTYIERDIRQLINVTSLLDFEKFMRICASRAGQIAVKSEIAKDVGVTVNTVQSWLSALEASNQLLFLSPYYENFGKRVIKTPKLYFSDPGLLLFLLGTDGESVTESPFIGALWENTVFVELKKRLAARMGPGQFWYYRDQIAREVDLLFVARGKVHFIETKWSTRPEQKSAVRLEAVANDLKSKVVQPGNCYIIARNEDSYPITPKTQVVSLFDFSLPD